MNQLLLLLTAALTAACSEKGLTTSAPPPPPVPQPNLTITALTVQGNTRLTAIGQTSQLTATVTYSDGSTQNVSNFTTWTSDISIVRISSSGLITAVSYGTTSVTANYSNHFTAVTAVATPLGTFAVRGFNREPGQGPLANGQVIETRSGRSTTINSFGGFTMGELPLPPHLRLERDGYETIEVDTAVDGSTVDLPMQRIVHVTAGETARPPRLAPNDMDYRMSSGAQCFPCRLIRIDVPSRGTLHLHLTWSGSIPLALWIGGTQYVRVDDASTAIDVDVPVNAGEDQIYPQILNPQIGVHVTFSVDTSLGP